MKVRKRPSLEMENSSVMSALDFPLKVSAMMMKKRRLMNTQVSGRSQTREVLGFEKLLDGNFSFPSHPLHNYSIPNLPQRPSTLPHTYDS